MQTPSATQSAPRSTRASRFLHVLVALAALLTAPAFANSYDYTYLSKFGSAGAGDGQFSGPPYGLNFVAIDSDSHRIAVADSYNSRVEVFSATGTFLFKFGTPGAGPGQFNGVGGIAVDPSTHNFVVADGAGRIEIFTSTGVFVRAFGSHGSGDGQLNGPAEIAIDPITRNIVVAEITNTRVQIFSPNGNYLGKFGSYGTGNGQFRYPCYLTIDPATRHILVADEINANVQIFSASGAFISKFGAPGSGNGQFGSPGPGALAIDAQTRNIVVEDYANNRIQVFSAGGAFLSKFGTSGNGDGQFNGPTGIDIDQSSHHIVVLDRSNSRAEIFALASAQPDPACGPTPVSIGIEPLTATSDQSLMFSGQAGIRAPFAGTISFVVDGSTAACTAAMVDVYATCFHPLLLGTHNVVAVYSGDGQNQPGCSAPQSVTIIPPGSQLPTGITCTPTPAQPTQGQAASMSCAVTAFSRAKATTGASTDKPGYVTFSRGSDALATIPVFGANVDLGTALDGGSYMITATYSGDGYNGSSTVDVPLTVTIPSDDIFFGSFQPLSPN